MFVECGNVSEGCPFTKIAVDMLEIHEQFECEYRIAFCEVEGCEMKGQPMPYKILQLHQQFECIQPKQPTIAAVPKQPERNDEKEAQESIECEVCGAMILVHCMPDHMVAHEFDQQNHEEVIEELKEALRRDE